MSEVKISYSQLINKLAKPVTESKVVQLKSILTNLRMYIVNSLNN